MPIGPNNISTVRHELLKWAFADIDSKLLDPQQSTRLVHGDSDDYYYQFVLPGHLNEQEKLEIKTAYENAGWPLVVVINSADRGERAGLFMVTLYSKATSRFLRS